MSDQTTTESVDTDEADESADIDENADTVETGETDETVDEVGSEDQTAEPDGSADASGPSGSGTKVEQLEREGDIAADYLEELLDIADFDGDLDMDVENGRASVSIVGGDLGRLVGERGEVLDALQELTRLAVLRETGDRSRLMLDIGGHRAERRTELQEVAREAIAEVRESGEPKALAPMNSFERKVVHDVVAESGLASDSDGVEPRRHVVVRPAEA